jgi:hypothetical protein
VIAYVETLLVSLPVRAVQRPVGRRLGPPVRLASGLASLSLVFFRLIATLSAVIVVVMLAILVAIVFVGLRLTGVVVP